MVFTGRSAYPRSLVSDIGLTFGGPSGFPQGRSDTLGVFSDTATLLRGRHTIKFGGEFRRYLCCELRPDDIGATYVCEHAE